MSNSIQDLISQLKKIDVGNLLEKAKTVKVEDFKSIKFSDLSKIKDSKYYANSSHQKHFMMRFNILTG